jgi:uncharacterized protein
MKGKSLNTRLILFTRYGGNRGNGKDKQPGTDSHTGRDTADAEHEGRTEGDVHDERKHDRFEEAGRYELGRSDTTAGGSGEGIWLQAERSSWDNRAHEESAKERKVVADTNILISATFWKGESRRILSMAERKEVILLTSMNILEEYIKVLEYPEVTEKVRKKGLPMVYNVLKVAKMARIVKPNARVDAVTDKDDNKILECAIKGKADYIVTYDQHLLKLGSYRRIRILTPQEFLAVL